MQTKSALSLLVHNYRAVLKKCFWANVMNRRDALKTLSGQVNRSALAGLLIAAMNVATPAVVATGIAGSAMVATEMMTEQAQAKDLTWSAEIQDWDNDDDDDGGNPTTQFDDGDNVTFNIANAEVPVVGDVAPKNIKINENTTFHGKGDEAFTITASGDITIAEGKELTLKGVEGKKGTLEGTLADTGKLKLEAYSVFKTGKFSLNVSGSGEYEYDGTKEVKIDVESQMTDFTGTFKATNSTKPNLQLEKTGDVHFNVSDWNEIQIAKDAQITVSLTDSNKAWENATINFLDSTATLKNGKMLTLKGAGKFIYTGTDEAEVNTTNLQDFQGILDAEGADKNLKLTDLTELNFIVGNNWKKLLLIVI